MEMGNVSEVIVDVGGGGEHMLRLAEENPDKTYVVVDPIVENISKKPQNLHLFRWQSDIDSGLPFKNGSVGEIRVNYLMGEIRSKEPDSGSIVDAKNIYGRLVKEVGRVLGRDGKVLVMDVKSNIEYVKDVFEEHGFKTTRPEVVEDDEATVWTRTFFKVVATLAKGRDESEALPMQIEASKR